MQKEYSKNEKIKYYTPIENPIPYKLYGWVSINKKPVFHNGIDLISKTNNKDVFAITDGIVIYNYPKKEEKGKNSKNKLKTDISDNYVIIEHIINNETYFVKYYHITGNNFKEGQKVKAGEKIGEYVKCTDCNYDTQEHLHLSFLDVRWDYIDPLEILSKLFLDVFRTK
jgi:murein DD-endopeptidase MepM/ murein hydrolase activator NlpD